MEQILLSNFQLLPEHLKAEVVHFAEFLASRAKSSVLGKHIEDNVMLIDEDEEKRKKKERIIAAFEGLKEIKSFHAIEDAVKWQREQRDEWE